MTHKLSKSKELKHEAVREWDEDERGKQWFGDVMIPLTESDDQRSTKKENIKSSSLMRKLTETFIQLNPWNRGREAPNSVLVASAAKRGMRFNRGILLWSQMLRNSD